MSLPITHRAVIPDAYMDEMGHMNVMWYTHLFSLAAWGLFQMVGLNREYFSANHAGSFALAQHFRYLKEVRLGQHVTLRSRVLGRSAKRWHSIHFMTIDELNVLAATAEVVSTHVDLTARRSSPMPATITDSIDRLLAEHVALGWNAPVCGDLKP
ncbi:MAG: thioesterase family protein [Gemmataceae bacterium]